MSGARMFQRGGPGGPGRPRKASTHKYLRVVRQECGKREWATICKKAVLQAINGDYRARDWLSKYLLPEQILAAQGGEVELRIVHEGADPFGDGETADATQTPAQGVA